MFRRLMVATATVTLSACALTPDYERPELDVPADYVETDPAGESIANMGWWDLFQDEQLELLVKTALEENKDRAVALSRILAARENVTFVRANQFPFFDLSGSLGRGQRSRELFPGADTDNRYSVFGDAAFQVDLWGQLYSFGSSEPL